MKIKFLKDYRYPGGGYSNKGDVQTFEDAEFAKWAIDNGFAEEVKPEVWKPKFNETYYFVDGSGKVDAEPWLNDELDEYRYSVGECFKTEKAAETWRGYRIARATVSRDEGVLTPKQVDELIKDEGLAYCVGYMINRDNEKVSCGCPMSFDDYWMPVGVILFDSEAHADSSLRKHPHEWKIISNYDWSRE